ncbi:thiamine pyrophosphate-requiring protein [Halorarum salinum]|uniref:Thiamine pyrophosphate-requiring protein n=1 Tax=Halorarum salinum TaxID=2743089 RepID=A0A7D5LCW9_9EURY|nr:thiamine pyrophosphate-requiring protein [Halobaculum salinum]QLG63853.1 thiamine pyrophosphate-requiring protein [Halobaculum salinum]
MDVTTAIAQSLKEEGVEYLFGFPSNPLFDTGAAEEVGIRTIITRQERTAAHMADAVGRMTSGEGIAAFACQHGPGTENSFGAIAQAYGESAPLVAIPAGYDRAKTDVDPKFNSLVNYQHVSKTCEQLTDPDAVGETMRRAFNAARNGRPRPAVVEVPKDVFYEDVPDFEYERPSVSRPGPDPSGVDEVADVLLEADRPVIFAGQGVHYAKGWDALRELAETLEAPVATSLNGKSAFPETHPLSLGAGSKSEPGQLAHFLREADVLFGVGCSFTSTAYGITVPEDNAIVHSTLDSTDVNKDVHADHALVGDARLTLEALVDAVGERLDGGSRGRFDDVAAEIEEVRDAWLDEWRPKLTSDETPINPYRVVHELTEVVDAEDAIITHDAGNPRDFLAPFWESTEPLSYIGWGKTTQLGYGLGLAMGAKLVHPEKLCINLWGDGAIGMTGLDFETAAREDIPILSIHLNNYEMAAYDTPFSGDFADVATALGGYGERVEDPDEVAPALERAIAETEEGTPALLEVITAKETELSRPDLDG